MISGALFFLVGVIGIALIPRTTLTCAAFLWLGAVAGVTVAVLSLFEWMWEA